MEHILSMIGLAHKAGRVEIGEEPVGSAARARHARVILLAADAADSTVRRAGSFARSGECLLLTVPAEKDQLGRALGRSSCAMAAITDIGLADAVIKKLAKLDPAQYGEAAERMEIKARRAAERKQEQLNHEKNLRQGKHRTSAETAQSAAPKKPKKTVEDKKPTRTRKDRQAAGREKQKAEARNRYTQSRPVKKGKGSSRKNK